MLIVIIIIGILAATLIPRIWNARNRATDTAKVADIKSIATALVAYSLENPAYPEKICTGTDSIQSPLLNSKYWLWWSMPLDPDKEGTAPARCYDYRAIGSDHFVLCARLSADGSSNGNATGNLVTGADFADLNYDQILNYLENTTWDYHCFAG